MSISQEKFKEMLKEKGLKVTNQRLLVLQVLAEHHEQHMTAEDIFELVKEDYPEIGLATIYRTVQLLLEMQLVDRIILDDGCVRYEIGDDLLENLEDHIEKETGFHVMDHELKFYGQCRKCREKQNNGK